MDVNDSSFEPFDNKLINTLLEKHNLVYNAGLGIRCRPHFFVAELEKLESLNIIREQDLTKQGGKFIMILINKSE